MGDGSRPKAWVGAGWVTKAVGWVSRQREQHVQRHRRAECVVNLGFSCGWSQEGIGGGRSGEEIDGEGPDQPSVNVKKCPNP